MATKLDQKYNYLQERFDARAKRLKKLGFKYASAEYTMPTGVRKVSFAYFYNDYTSILASLVMHADDDMFQERISLYT